MQIYTCGYCRVGEHGNCEVGYTVPAGEYGGTRCDCHCQRKKPDDELIAIKQSTFRSTYQPEMWNVRKDIIYAAIDSISSGIEYAEMTLQAHDQAVGRTTYRNKSWAYRMEQDIKNMTQALEGLKQCHQSPPQT